MTALSHEEKAARIRELNDPPNSPTGKAEREWNICVSKVDRLWGHWARRLGGEAEVKNIGTFTLGGGGRSTPLASEHWYARHMALREFL